MEWNLAWGSAHTRSCSHGDARLRETRSSYFLNLLLRGRLSTDEIEVEMDKERGLILRGKTYCKEVEIIKWKCRLMSKRGNRFKIPEDVNVSATRGSFGRHNLHVVMPKLMRQSRISPYHVIHIHSSPRQAKSPAAVKVNHYLSCSYYTSEVINKNTTSSSTSCVSNAEGKIQQYHRRRRRSINKIIANSSQ